MTAVPGTTSAPEMPRKPVFSASLRCGCQDRILKKRSCLVRGLSRTAIKPKEDMDETALASHFAAEFSLTRADVH